MRKILWVIGLLACAAACGDSQEPGENGNTNNGSTNNGGTNNGGTNNGGTNNGGTNNGGTNNGMVQRPACETIEAQDSAEAAYDVYLLPPLEDLLGSLTYVEARVTQEGDMVSVHVDDDEIPAVFESGAGFEHCVANPEADFIKLCFFTAAGEPAVPGALGAVFRPFGNALFAVVAHRRGVSRPCTPAGHYDMDTKSITSMSGDEAFVAQVRDALLDYLALFLIDGTATLVFADEPRQLALTYSDAELTFSGSFEDELTLVEDGPVYDFTIEFSKGSIDLTEEGVASISATAAIVVSEGDLSEDVSLNVELSGVRP